MFCHDNISADLKDSNEICKTTTDKYSLHSSTQLKHDSRKRTHDERDDRDIKKGSTLIRKIYRTNDRPRAVRRSHRIPGKERKYDDPSITAYEQAYDNPTNINMEETPKIYEAKPVPYGENKPKIIDNQPTFFEHKPKVSNIQEIKPKVQDVKIQELKVYETTAEEKPLSIAERTRTKRFNELSPLMTSMVEDELKNIMIKIWQTLPDDAPNDAEKLVLDKLKKDAGDDLRNTIGLNVTKRLLNVNNNPAHKGLLIKVRMNSSVSTQDIYEFSKKYYIGNLKYVQQRTYAGRMQSWTDLDELYSIKNLRCGKAKVTITPIYNFLKCPLMLKTVFDGKQDYASKEIEKEAAKIIKKPEEKNIITADKVLAEDAKKVTVKKETISTDKKVDGDVKTEPNKTDTKESPKNVASKTSANKPSQTSNVQTETVKQKATKTDTNVTNAKPTETAASKTVTSSNIKKEIKQETKVEPAKTPNKSAPINTAKKETFAPKPLETKSNSKKVEPKIPVTQAAKPIVKPVQTNDSLKKDEVTKQAPNKTVAKVATSPANKEPTKTVAKESAKTIVKEPVKTIAKEPIKLIAKEPAKQIATEPAKPITKETKPISKEAKSIATKTTTPAKKVTVTPKAIEKKTVTKTSSVVPKAIAKAPIKTTKVDTKAKNNGDDFDELDDHDILALLSSGIVLDECSGSDVD